MAIALISLGVRTGLKHLVLSSDPESTSLWVVGGRREVPCSPLWVVLVVLFCFVDPRVRKIRNEASSPYISTSLFVGKGGPQEENHRLPSGRFCQVRTRSEFRTRSEWELKKNGTDL